MLKRTHFLRFFLVLIAGAVITLGLFALPTLWTGGAPQFWLANAAARLMMIGLYATMIPFFVGWVEAFKLLKYFDQDRALSAEALSALKKIKYCTAIIGTLYVGGIPLLYPIAQADDAPGLILFGTAFACAPIALTIFVSLLEKLLRRVLAK